MERKTSAHYQRLHRARLREQGLVKKELWVLPEYLDELSAVEKTCAGRAVRLDSQRRTQ